MKTARLILSILAGLMSGSTLVAVSLGAQGLPMSAAEQIRISTSAAPVQLQGGASIYVLGDAGYHIARRGTNGYHCLVERWDRDVVTPICYDDVGAESTLQAVFFLEAERAAGTPDSIILEAIDSGYESGRFRAPQGMGVAYMLSFESAAPPHVMYYAPYATNEDFGGAESSSRSVLPFVYDPGSPRAYIVQLVDEDALRRTLPPPG